MLASLVILLILSAASCAVVLFVARNAPEGYEDHDGFKLGPNPADLGRREVGVATAVRDEAGRGHAAVVQIPDAAPEYQALLEVF